MLGLPVMALLCNAMWLTAAPSQAHPPAERVVPGMGPPGYTYAAEKLERFEKDVVATFVASRALGDKLVRQRESEGTVMRTEHDISRWHDPAWDDAALIFLRNWGRLSCGAPEAKSVNELVTDGWNVIEAGCREPMVLYAYAWLLESQKKDNSARQTLLQAASSMQFTEYPQAWRAAIEARYAFNLSRAGLDPAAREHHRAAGNHLLSAIKANEFAGKQSMRELASKSCDRCCPDAVPLDVAAEFIEQFTAIDAVDRCTYHTVLGKFHTRRAWEFRGRGMANTVTEDGWTGFSKQLDIACDHLMKAHQLDPTRPEAASGMIALCKAGKAPPGTDLGYWLDRVIEAQMDYRPAFAEALNSLLPRWGGSHEAALELGVACALTERFDTELPLVFLDAVRQVFSDTLQPARQVVDSPEIYELICRITAKMEEQPNHRHRREWLRSVRLAVAYQSGRLDDAKQVAEHDDMKLDPVGLAFFGATPKDVQRLVDTSTTSNIANAAQR